MSISEAESGSETIAENRQPRQSRLAKATVECARFGRFDITVRNVSPTGLGAQAPHILNLGERLTIDLPGHDPMTGTVRWVVDRRFGVETDAEIRLDRLRSAHGERLPSADSSIEFRILPPSKMPARRPGLKLGAASPEDQRRSKWTNK